MRKVLMLTALLLMAVVMSAAELKPVKYVFLFIGDGMSIPQRMLIDNYRKITRGEPAYINRMPYAAITTTSSASAFITDSAASGTAIACGEKTKNGRIGMNTAGDKDLFSVATHAKQNGRKVGIVSSVTLNHATPASFYGHRQNRGQYYEIGLDLVASEFDYFAGGGISKYNDTGNEAFRGDIYDLAAQGGYHVIEIASGGRAAFDALAPGEGKVLASIGGDMALPYVIDNLKCEVPSLAEFVAKGIELLDNPKGFFMMVEGGMIDWCGHANDAGTMLGEVAAFDDAVKVAKAFADKHPEETLIVVTGDHETGGLTLGFANSGYQSKIDLLKEQRCSSVIFARKVTEFFKTKPQASFEDIQPLVTENFGLKFTAGKDDPMLLTKGEKEKLQAAFDKHVAALKEAAEKKTRMRGNPFASAVMQVMNSKAGLGWASGDHTALPVNTTADGVQAEAFSGMIDNTDIAKKLKQMVR